MRVADWVFGLILLIGAGLILREASGFAEMPGQDYGPALLPSIVAVGFAICGLVLVASGLRARAPALALDPQARAPGRLPDAALTIGAVVFTMLVWDVLGFIIVSTIVLTLLCARFWGGRIIPALLVGVIGSLVIDWLFRKMLLVPLPLGPFAGWIW
ncbi:MAG TPA: tripartite tricarboxylate transporter TctB family protein [Geminicoccus sp.]|jgi:putative tricarboxylic transport membrane protein|uniref:tripartite tricarboxylate transporter TctB family protein n=1 Tax=Geminicoccus sp. TaxID=2024832 RepID=UPI002E330CAA|nr:tripartite tricarboxylate transporter TctB family protein [Geminicoccus sp.]HEX2524933.1 tripartite tricarboxylate transporter TctB family protein [Geminicoccus sp.]